MAAGRIELNNNASGDDRLYDLDAREAGLRSRLEELNALEREVAAREQELRNRDARRKQIILRLPESLWHDIARWAEDDFRSVNSQIEYLLTRSVRDHNKGGCQ